MLLVSCKPEAEKPTVVTKSVGEVTETSAKVVGQVTADGGAEVTERGVCWNTTAAPEVIDYRMKDVEGGLGIFTLNIPDLVPNTQYYVRAYATNEKGVSYGEEMTLTTLKEIELPTVTTAEVEDITETTAVSGGEVTYDGGGEVTVRGICWSTKQNPTIEDNKTTDGKGVGSFTSQIPDLVPNTQYYVRAYATNEKGTAYGEEVSFTTEEEEEPEEPGDEPEEPGDEPEEPGDEPEEPGDEPEEPGDEPEEPGDEPEEPGDEPEEPGDEPEEPGDEPEEPGDEPEDPEQPEEVAPVVTTAEVTDIKLFSAVCGGEVISNGEYVVVARGVCWSMEQNPTIEDSHTTDGVSTGTYVSNLTELNHGTTYYVRAYAINANGITAYGEEKSFTTLDKLLPTVTTTEVTGITCLTAVSGGEVTFDGNVKVTVRGICWSTRQNPTIEDSKTNKGSGVGTYTYKMTNLELNTKYYVRAYATNEVGTSYGEEVSFTTLAAYSPATGSSNGYGYVDLGLSVKWATCNVGATSPEGFGKYYACGETTTKAEYNSSNCPTYGLSKSELKSQGYIDSEGNLTPQYDAATANWGGTWRMPTYAELKELNTQCTWEWINTNGVEGYSVIGPNGNSIFLPAAGRRDGSSLFYAGSYGYYWSSTPYDYFVNGAYYLYFDSCILNMNYGYRYYGQSLRPVLE